MARPNLNITLLNNQLGIVPPSEFGNTIVLVGSPEAPTAGYGIAFVVRSKADVIAAFPSQANVPVVEAFNKHFYAEAPEGTTVTVLAMVNSTPLATMLAAANADKPLTLANGSARLIGVLRIHPGNYTPTVANGMDQDCYDAINAAQTIADAQLAKYQPVRILVQSFALTTAGALSSFATNTKRNVGCVQFSINNSTANALMQVLGRAAAVEPHINIGRVKSGSLKLDESAVVRIGATAIENVADSVLEELHLKRFISVERNKIASGVVITDDVMLTAPTDDYNSLTNGRVIDNVVRVAHRTYYAELKESVEVTAGGRLPRVQEQALQGAVQSQVDLQMPGQLSRKENGQSALTCLVNPDPAAFPALYSNQGITSPNLNLLQTNGRLYIFLTCRPRGYYKDIQLFIGLSPTAGA